MHSLKIINLSAEIEGHKILNGVNLEINTGEIHAIMGPNGTGKSTLSKVIMGDPSYQVTEGEIYFDDCLINDMTPDKRSHLGIFLGMQLPMEIEGVTNADFLRAALHAKDEKNFKLMPFIRKLDQTVAKLDMEHEMIHRSINKGFSGGERKKNEILQMYMLEPSMVLLDEIDSGLDVDSLKVVGERVMEYYHEDQPGILLVTHYQRLLDYIKPDFVHIMIDGTIVKSGDASLVSEIETNGYTFLEESKKVEGLGAGVMKESIEHE